MPDGNNDDMEAEFHLPGIQDLIREEMLDSTQNTNFRSALITGCPGSGKTTVAIYRLVRLNSQNFRVRLLTYQNMLVLFIQNIVLKEKVKAGRVSTFHSWFCNLTHVGFDTNSPPTAADVHKHLAHVGMRQQTPAELLIDEGQDLPRCVYEAIPHYYERVFVGGDRGQQVHRHGTDPEEIEAMLQQHHPPYQRYHLGQNFRNTYETYRFARQFIPKENEVAWDDTILQRLLRKNRRGKMPRVITYRDPAKRNAHMQRILRNANGNVAILCPIGATARARISGESVEEMHTLITQMGFKATKYYNELNQVPTTLKRFLVTTFISAKGLEFDTVVIPRINFFREIPEEWYVACTRARGQLIVYRDLNSYQGSQYDPIRGFESDTYDAETVETPAATPAPDKPF